MSNQRHILTLTLRDGLYDWRVGQSFMVTGVQWSMTGEAVLVELTEMEPWKIPFRTLEETMQATVQEQKENSRRIVNESSRRGISADAKRRLATLPKG